MARTKTYRCSRCKRSKKETSFYNSQWRDGAWCKACYALDYSNRSKKVRWQIILREYGLSQVDYQNMLEAQGGVCAICKKPEQNRRFKFLAVDHDHLTNKIRGLLCHRCNAGLGNFYDTVALLRTAVDYLERNALLGLRGGSRFARGPTREPITEKLRKLRCDVSDAIAESSVCMARNLDSNTVEVG